MLQLYAGRMQGRGGKLLQVTIETCHIATTLQSGMQGRGGKLLHVAMETLHRATTLHRENARTWR